MAPPRKQVKRPDGFEVVCSIGFVQFEPNSTESATEAAMKVIGSHVEEMDNPSGIFTFPHPAGGNYNVSVVVTD